MRQISVIAFVVALAAGLAVPVAADSQTQTRVERTVSCPTELRALQIGAYAYDPAAGTAAANVFTGDLSTPKLLVGVDTRYKHYVLSNTCRRVITRVALTHRGLTSAGVSRLGDYQSRTVYCAATARILLHFELGFDSSGKPVSETVAIRTQPKAPRKSRAIAYVQWTPQKSVTYYSTRACTSN